MERWGMERWRPPCPQHVIPQPAINIAPSRIAPSHRPPSHHPPSLHLHIRSCYLQPMAEPILGGPASVVETACPLDCPDACSLSVTVQQGKVITIDGSHKKPLTDGYICAKVGKVGERGYGTDPLLY